MKFPRTREALIRDINASLSREDRLHEKRDFCVPLTPEQRSSAEDVAADILRGNNFSECVLYCAVIEDRKDMVNTIVNGCAVEDENMVPGMAAITYCQNVQTTDQLVEAIAGTKNQFLATEYMSRVGLNDKIIDVLATHGDNDTLYQSMREHGPISRLKERLIELGSPLHCTLYCVSVEDDSAVREVVLKSGHKAAIIHYYANKITYKSLVNDSTLKLNNPWMSLCSTKPKHVEASRQLDPDQFETHSPTGIYIKTDHRYFAIGCVASDDKEMAQYLSLNQNYALIATDQNGHHYLANLEGEVIKNAKLVDAEKGGEPEPKLSYSTMGRG